ncbi:DUF3347 domain-containing protein [Pontibacter qinzhouensis]|uniref:DUF3347 domain-containing protein n=1 Tax=Pontibacter qinzhouensis TaxID=2603253 RepID=A0A5C8K4Y3_9BACT|nr:DUF3347 domain-containing protein [Pontibacter qinzhouensis]TXK44143.1 DUF3347 domain-containing protein [Pontibacter qinzhouensis]
MKKLFAHVAMLAALSLSACSENKTETTDAHGSLQDAAAGAIVVESPSFSSVPDPVKTQIASLLSEYLKLKDALVEESAQNAKAAAANMVELTNSMPVATLTGEQKEYAEQRTANIQEKASAIAATTDLGAQRQQLEELSEATFALTKAFGAADSDLYYQHCPMAFNDKGAYWLSSEKEIRNPYYGKSMLKCGTNEEVFTN